MARTAKIRKKATKKHHRYQRAQRNLRLATVAALAQGMYYQTINNINLDTKREREQLERIKKWSDKCLDNIQLGKHALDQSTNLVRAIDNEVRRYADGSPQHLGHYCMVWLMIGYLCDESRPIANSREWNYLASVVNTWTGWMLEHISEDYEEKAGELAERARNLIIREA